MTSGYTQHKQAAGKKKVKQKRKAGAARSLESQVYISANAIQSPKMSAITKLSFGTHTGDSLACESHTKSAPISNPMALFHIDAF